MCLEPPGHQETVSRFSAWRWSGVSEQVYACRSIHSRKRVRGKHNFNGFTKNGYVVPERTERIK
jgi:hypothetical protein